MKTIPLSGGKAFALVSDCDFERLSKFRWTLQINKRPNVDKHYAARWEWYRDKKGKRKRRKKFMHREVMEKELAIAPPGYVVDHSPDKSGLNNQRENLSVVPQSKNIAHILEDCRGCYCAKENFNPICCPQYGAADKSGEW
jgi:hypothetical protein